MIIRKSSWSRLELVGEYIMDSPFRLGDGTPDGGIALDPGGRPFIPATSFRGALRSYVEAMLRAMDSEAMSTLRYMTITGIDGKPVPIIRRVAICCDGIEKSPRSLNYQGCLTEGIVELWEKDALLDPPLDQAVPDCTCFACRIFGTSWLSGKIQISDLTLIDGTWNELYEVRGGITLSRDSGTMIEGSTYLRRVLPAGLRMTFRLVLENATVAEQGAILLGLRAFELGWIALGGDRSRGLGQGHLEIDWWNCHYTDPENLINALLLKESPMFTETDAELRIAALSDLLNGLSRKE